MIKSLLNKIMILIFYLIIGVSVTDICLANSLPFELEADQIFLNNDETILNATGNIILEYKTYTIKSDIIHYSKDSGIITFINNIELSDINGNIINGSFLELDIETESGTLKNGSIKTIYNYFITAESIQLNQNKIHLKSTSITTCENKKPHYYFHSKETHANRNNEYINAKENHLYFYNLPIFYFPEFNHTIEKESNDSPAPKIGYNNIDGTYGILNTGYFINSNSNGYIGIGTSQKRGLRYGITHTFLPQSNQNITVSAYNVKKTGFEGGFRYKWKKVNNKVKADPIISQLFFPIKKTYPETTLTIDYLYNKVIHTQLYDAIPEITLKFSNIDYYLNSKLSMTFGTGYFNNNDIKNSKLYLLTSSTKKLLESNSINISNILSIHNNYYPSKSKWERLFNTLSIEIPMFNTLHTVGYTEVFYNNGTSPFIFDTINEIVDDEISLESKVFLTPFTLGIKTNYQIHKQSYRNFKYSVDWTIHCWQLNVSIDTIWNEIMFGISIPQLN